MAFTAAFPKTIVPDNKAGPVAHRLMAEESKRTISSIFLASYNELLWHLSQRLGRKVDADDVLQNTFLRIQKIPVEAEIANPRSYLFRMVDNLAVDHMRGQRTLNRHFAAEEAADKVDESPSPERVVDYRQRLARLRQAVSELPDRQRQVFLMHKFDGLSHTEIADKLGITKSAVEKLIMKALAHLRVRVGDLID